MEENPTKEFLEDKSELKEKLFKSEFLTKTLENKNKNSF